MNNKQKNRILSEVHETASGLFKIGLISQNQMQDFDALCLSENNITLEKKSELVNPPICDPAAKTQHALGRH